MNMELMEHCNDVAEIAMDIALEMKLCPFYIAQIGLAALYHDIGKEYIPNSILNKPGKLTEDEQQMMIAHTYIGHWMIKAGETDLADMISEVVLHHHENFDGSGYYCKKNDDISLAARIIHLADVFSAITTDRAYRTAWDLDEAIYYIEKNSGTLFDPVVADAFLSLVDRYSDLLLEANDAKEVT